MRGYGCRRIAQNEPSLTLRQPLGPKQVAKRPTVKAARVLSCTRSRLRVDLLPNKASGF